MNIYINNTEFEMNSYYYLQDGVCLTLPGSIALTDIETAAGDSTQIRIEDSVIINDLFLKSVVKEYNNVSQENYYRVTFTEADLKQQVNRLKTDLAAAQAANATLQSELSDTQMALTELYETVIGA